MKSKFLKYNFKIIYKRIVLYFRVFLFFLSRTTSPQIFTRIATWNKIGDTNAWNRNLRTENLYSWITVVFYLANARRILSLRNLFRSTVSSKVFHQCFVLSAIHFKEAGKEGEKHLIGNILKTYFHRIIYEKMSNKIFMFSKRDVIFFMTTFRYNLSLSRLNSTLDCTRCWRI